VGGVGQEEDGDRGLDEAADDVGGEHDALAGEAVGPHAADREGDDAGDGGGREDEAEGAGGVGDGQGREGEGDGDEGVADGGDSLAHPEQAEVGLGEGGQG